MYPQTGIRCRRMQKNRVAARWRTAESPAGAAVANVLCAN
ncbi:hypothetical protein I553_6503 [Mycobacterium xenopi 4042]|uniref:Uncharacterized protein n=1 Tax=Mycobacterium xenopi 4042 TaxID=1299334 RepID=X8BHC4_MYCXE|nr:hypothetical protein I552_6280 [Mycobacterium xenopi 3993]EUA42643.1 hypothetical protein I553_6503 [Mycobacterium xenopi 4042]